MFDFNIDRLLCRSYTGNALPRQVVRRALLNL